MPTTVTNRSRSQRGQRSFAVAFAAAAIACTVGAGSATGAIASGTLIKLDFTFVLPTADVSVAVPGRSVALFSGSAMLTSVASLPAPGVLGVVGCVGFTALRRRRR